MALLRLEEVSRNFGGLRALSDVTLEVNQGEILGLIGPNGAGKTTLFNMISGFDRPSSGRVLYQQEEINGWPAYRRARAGIGRTFQSLRLFHNLTVLDHVILGQHPRRHISVLEAFLRPPGLKEREAELVARGMALLEFVGLAERHDQQAQGLPYGLQRRLEIARALAFEPELLLLDEPLSGMTPEEKREVVALIREMNGRGITIFLIDHDMRALMSIVDRVEVLHFGKVIARGTPAEVQNDPLVIEAYLGEEEAA